MQLSAVAPAFVEMAHQIVWCSVATVDTLGRPRSRVLHPIWEWDGAQLVGWVCTSKSPVKSAHLAHRPFVSCNYWATNQDTCVADCRVTWIDDADDKRALWQRFTSLPEPIGYDPSIIGGWTSPEAPSFSGLRLDPWHVRVFPGTIMLEQKGQILSWRESATTASYRAP